MDKKSDIDFDELDKAVNSLMGKVGTETIDDEAETTKTLAIDPTLDPGKEPRYDALGGVVDKVVDTHPVREKTVELGSGLTDESITQPESLLPTPTKITSVSAPVAKPAAKRPHSGRFMDMVHPSADMRSPASSSATISVPERSMKPIESTPVSVPELAPAQGVVSEPIGDTAPMTPFLPDAQVEKRPLGGSSLAFESEDEANTKGEQQSEQPNVDQVESFETVPVNSEHGVLDNKSSDEQRALNPSDFEKLTTTEQELQRIEAAEIEAEQSASAQETVDKSDENPPSAEQDSTDNPEEPRKDTANGAIYDVNNYHQPLSHPAKQKSGIGKVLIIIAIIVVFAAIGAGAFLLFGLPN